MKILLLSLGILFASELEVQGNLKVTGTVDATGNPITNVGEPVVSSDVATANYVLERTTTKGRIIAIKCVWVTNASHNSVPSVGSCEPPACPNGWNSLITFNEVTAASAQGYNDNTTKVAYGNSVRYCMEQEDEE